MSEPPEGQGGGADIIAGGCGRSSKGSSGDTSYDISVPSGHASNDSEIEMLNQGRGHFVCVSQRELRRAPPCRKQVVLTRPQNYHRLQLCKYQRVLNHLLRARLSCGRMIRLFVPPPFPLPSLTVKKLSFCVSLPMCRRLAGLE